MTRNFKQLWKESKKDPCWKGYEKIGTKKKDGEEVPNCVPKKESKEIKEQDELDDIQNTNEPIDQPETELSNLEAEDIVQADMEGGPEADEEPVVTPEEIGDEELAIAEAYAKKIETLNNKKAKMEEELNTLIKEIEKNKKLGQKKYQYDEAKNKVAQLKEELDEIKNSEELEGGLADGMDNEDIAKLHGVSKDEIDQQVKIGTDVEAEHTDDPEKQKEIAQDHEVEDPEYYQDEDGLDLADVEAEAELEKNKMDEGKKNKKDVTSLNKATGTKSGTDPIGKYGKTEIKTKKDKERDPKQRRRKDKQKGYDQLDENKHKYLKEAFNRVKKSENKEKGDFTFHMG